MSESRATSIDRGLARSAMPRQERRAHKWEVGGVLVIAGSPAYPGAALLASRAAGRAGAGIVLLATTRQVIAAIAGAVPEVAFVPLPETESVSGTRSAITAIEERLPRMRSVVIGPGLGVDDAATSLLRALFGFGEGNHGPASRIGFGPSSGSSRAEANGAAAGPLLVRDDLPIVVDADALTWLAAETEWWTRVPKDRLILTPHPGEMSRLLDIDVEDVLKDPVATVREAATRWKQTVLLKGSPSHVADGSTTRTAADSPESLATAGSGDVLSGAIGGLLAQGASTLDAATAALWAGPRAARLVESRFGAAGIVATDLPEAYAEAFADLVESHED